MTAKPAALTRLTIDLVIEATGSVSAAADALGVSQPSLRRMMRDLEIPTPRARGWARVSRPAAADAPHAKPRASRAGQDSRPAPDEDAAPVPRVDRDSAFADLSHALMLTGGRWRDLAALAEKHGMTVRQMQLRWFQLRLPVQKAVR